MLVSKKQGAQAKQKKATPLPVEAPQQKPASRVRPEDLLPGLSYTRELTPSTEARGARWTFRHPDLDGNSFTGKLPLRGLDVVLSAERGAVTTDVPEHRRALEKMGWVLWRTENEGYLPPHRGEL